MLMFVFFDVYFIFFLIFEVATVMGFVAWYGLPMGKLSYSDNLRVHTPWQVSHCLVYAEWLSQCGRLN